jgi:uncharacterized protein YqcC (DUF446 family)
LPFAHYSRKWSHSIGHYFHFLLPALSRRFAALALRQKRHMTETTLIEEKVLQIIREMKTLGLWIKNSPDWVTDFEKKLITSRQDFSEWLQFVFLPNCLQEVRNSRGIQGRKQIVLQAKRFLADDIKKGKLLQLLIELDALT